MSRYDHKIETSLEGIEHLSKENKDNKRFTAWSSFNTFIPAFFPNLCFQNKKQELASGKAPWD